MYAGADGGVELGTSFDFGVQFAVHELEAVAFFLEFVAYAACLDLEDLAIRRSAGARLNSGCCGILLRHWCWRRVDKENA